MTDFEEKNIDELFQPLQQDEPKKQLVAGLMIVAARDIEEALTLQQAVIQTLIKQASQTDVSNLADIVKAHHDVNDTTIDRVSERAIKLSETIKSIMSN